MKKMLLDMLRSRLFGNLFSLTLIRGFDYVMPLILFPFLFRRLGLETIGLIYFSQAFIGYFLMVTEFGFNLSATHYIASNREDNRKITRAYSAVLQFKLFLCLLGFAVMSGIIFTFARFEKDAILFICNYGVVLGAALLPVWFFQAVEQMRFITYLVLFARMLSIIPIFFLVKGPADYLVVPVLFSVGSIASGLLGLLIVRMHFRVRLCLLPLREIYWHAKQSSYFFLARASVTIYGTTGTFVLGLVGGDAVVGVFGSAQKVMQAYGGIVSPLQQAIYPYMIRTRNLSVFRRIFNWVTWANVLFVTVVILLAGLVVRILFKTDDVAIIRTLQIMMVQSYATIPAILLGYPLLGVFRSTKKVNDSTVVASVAYLLLLAILYLFGWINIYAMAAIMVFCEFLILGMRLFYLRGVPLEAKVGNGP